MSSIIRKARVLLSSTMLYAGVSGRAIFVGFVWEPAARPDGSLIEAAQGGQFGLGPWARYFLSRFSSLGSPLSSG